MTLTKNTKEYIEEKKKQGLYGWEGAKPVHLGETLRDEMAFWGLTQADMAARVGCSVQTINRIVKGRESLSPEIAIKLERAFNDRPDAQFWLNMQEEYNRKKEIAEILGDIKREV